MGFMGFGEGEWSRRLLNRHNFQIYNNACSQTFLKSDFSGFSLDFWDFFLDESVLERWKDALGMKWGQLPYYSPGFYRIFNYTDKLPTAGNVKFRGLNLKSS